MKTKFDITPATVAENLEWYLVDKWVNIYFKDGHVEKRCLILGDDEGTYYDPKRKREVVRPLILANDTGSLKDTRNKWIIYLDQITRIELAE